MIKVIADFRLPIADLMVFGLWSWALGLCSNHGFRILLCERHSKAKDLRPKTKSAIGNRKSAITSLLFLVDHPQRVEDEVGITQGLNLDWVLLPGFLKLKSAGVDLNDMQETLLS